MTLWGIDVSSHQTGIPQSVIAQADVVIIKATEGTSYTNPAMADQFTKALNSGKKIGVYHYYNGPNPEGQADYFLAQVAKVGTPDFYVLDWEEAAYLPQEKDAKTFLDRVKKAGLPVWFYTYASPLVKYQYSSIGDAGYPLWLAWYPYRRADGFGADMSLADAIKRWQITGWNIAGWQYTSGGRLTGWGSDLDFNQFDPSAPGLGATSTGWSTSSSKGMVYPVEGYPITQSFNDGHGLSTNLGGGHTGVDWGTPVGTPLKAVAPGTVLWADWADNLPQTSWADRWYLVGGGYGGLSTNAGICLVIDHGAYLSTYSHLNRTDLNSGDSVRAGQVVAHSGNTGYTTGPHLHFEILPKPFAWGNGFYGRVDPIPFIEARKGNSTEGDWLDMATKEEVKSAVREVLNEPIKRQGGEPGHTTIISETAWKTARDNALENKINTLQSRVFHLWTDWRMGVPGRAFDGAVGWLVRKSGYKDPENRAKVFEKAEKNGWM